MNGKYTYHALMLIFFAFSCRKELPKLPDAELPVFFVEASGADIALNLRAGTHQVSFNDSETFLQSVKKYDAQFQMNNTSVRMSFFGGELFSVLQLEDIENLSDFTLLSMESSIIQTISASDLSASTFSTLAFGLSEGNNFNSLEFHEPGKYNLFCEATRNTASVELINEVIVAYDNPYVFELRGTVIGSGPAAILQGEILANTANISQVDWSCGTNANSSPSTWVQFSPLGSANILNATVHFTDGTIRSRSVAIGLQDQPKIEDYTYIMEQNNSLSFSKKMVIELNWNGQTYTSLLATEFLQGQPFLNITETSHYLDPVTKRKSYLFKANGLVYLKNTTTQETIPFNLNLSFGLPFSF